MGRYVKKKDFQLFAGLVLTWLFVVMNRRTMKDDSKIKVAKDFNDAADAAGLDLDFLDLFDQWKKQDK